MNRVQTRASRGKFLALLASLAMIAAGVFGLTVASPASATASYVQNYLNQSGTAISAATYGKYEAKCSTIDPKTNDGWHFIITADAYKDANFTFSSQFSIVSQYRASNGAYHIFVSTPIGATLNGSQTWAYTQTERGNGQFTLSHTCPGTPTPDSGTIAGGSYDYCDNGTDGSVEWSGASYGPNAQYETKAAAQKAVDDAKAAAMAKVPGTATEGKCVPESGTIPGGSYEYCDSGTDGSVTWDAVKYGPEETYKTKAAAQKAVDDAEAAAMAKVPGTATEGTCKPGPKPTPDPDPEVVTYKDSATLAATQDICTANGTVTVDVKGNGLGESKVSQADAKKVAEGNARLDLDYNLTMAKAQFPGATDGACAPVTTPVVEPAVVEAPAEELSSVAVPAAATVQQAPEAVAVPAAATVPTAVPAGEGPADSGFPTWALVLIVLGAAGAAITGAQALKKQ